MNASSANTASQLPPPVGIALEFPQMHDLVHRPDVANEVADQLVARRQASAADPNPGGQAAARRPLGTAPLIRPPFACAGASPRQPKSSTTPIRPPWAINVPLLSSSAILTTRRPVMAPSRPGTRAMAMFVEKASDHVYPAFSTS
jgi:hypothetical protein